MVANRSQHSEKRPVKQGSGSGASSPNRIGASTPVALASAHLLAVQGVHRGVGFQGHRLQLHICTC